MPRVRIGVNAARLSGQRLGVGRYLEYLLRHWASMLEEDEQVTAYLRGRPAPGDFAFGGTSVQAVHLNSRLPGLVWENAVLRRRAREVDVLFCPAYSAPLWYSGAFVVAIHSMEEGHPGAQSLWHRLTYAKVYRSSAKRARAVIVPSESTKADVVKIYGIDPARIAIVHQGVDDQFQPMDDPTVLRATRMRFFGKDRPFVLFVGKCSKRRNIPLLIEAFAKVKREQSLPHGLLLFGPNHLGIPLAPLCRALGVEGSVVQVDGVVERHSDLVPVYCAADAFVHPSAYEGWSITTVEALACGAAVIAVNQGGLGEIANGYAWMLEEPTVTSIADGLKRVLLDAELRRGLRQSARRRGLMFSWHETAFKTLAVLREAAAESQPEVVDRATVKRRTFRGDRKPTQATRPGSRGKARR